MTSNAIIIFGAAGQVGCTTAIVAQGKGAKVFLGMRDTNKTIPGLSPEQERSAGLGRVHADLTKPETVLAAVGTTGAKRAFLYLVIGHSMRPSIEALKSAGVEFIVFLSSHSVRGELHSVTRDNIIAWQHAQVEIALQEVFTPDNYVAVRPGYFASNTFSWKRSIAKGQVPVPYSNVIFDYISPTDIGRVCGTLLATGPQQLETRAGKSIVGLLGPQLLTQRDAALTIGEVVGKELQIADMSDLESEKIYVEEHGLPEVAAKGLVAALKALSEAGGGARIGGYEGPLYDEAVANTLKFTGQKGTSFVEWVEENKAQFEA